MIPLKITALLFSGFASSDRWSPTIDGILGYWQMRRLLGDEEFALYCSHDKMMKPVEDLPLEKIIDGDLWWFACSSPIYHARVQMKHYLHRRFNTQTAETWLDTPKSGKIMTAAGPYKEYRRAIMQHVCSLVEWHVIGDEAGIRDLLRHCTHIGQKVGAGFGRVREWQYSSGDEETALFHRPLPMQYARRYDIHGPEIMQWGIRPPGRLPSNQALCVMPCGS